MRHCPFLQIISILSDPPPRCKFLSEIHLDGYAPLTAMYHSSPELTLLAARWTVITRALMTRIEVGGTISHLSLIPLAVLPLHLLTLVKALRADFHLLAV